MGKVVASLKFFFVALLMSTLVHSSSSVEERTDDDDHWFQGLHYSKPRLTRLRFYLHDIISGPGQSSFAVIPPAKSINSSSTYFGQVNMVDDALTEGPEPTSKLLGRAQGLYGFASQEDISLLMAVTFVLTSGEHEGSSFTIMGCNAVEHSPREFPVVGGTGKFRLGRGFAAAKTYYINDTIATVEYDVTVVHY